MSITFMRTGSRSHIMSSDTSIAVRKRRSSSSRCLRCRNCPIWLPMTLMEAISVIGSQIGQFLQRKQPEEELRRFRTAMDVAEDMIWPPDPVRREGSDNKDTPDRKRGDSR